MVMNSWLHWGCSLDLAVVCTGINCIRVNCRLHQGLPWVQLQFALVIVASGLDVGVTGVSCRVNCRLPQGQLQVALWLAVGCTGVSCRLHQKSNIRVRLGNNLNRYNYPKTAMICDGRTFSVLHCKQMVPGLRLVLVNFFNQARTCLVS